MDLGFIVERDSTISSFHIRGFVAEVKHNEKFEGELYTIAVAYMKEKYPIWVPGQIRNVSIRTDNNVRLTFSK